MNFHPQIETKTATPAGKVAHQVKARSTRPRPQPTPHPLTLLSFVKDLPKRGTGRNFWSVRSTGNYAQDCLLGHAFGEEYLSYVRKGTNGDVVLLGWIVEAMIEQALKDGEIDTGRGLRIGFLHTVNTHAVAAAKLFANSN